MRRGRPSGELRSVGEANPTYVPGRQRSEFIAHFSSGATIQVELGRRRRYPGLPGPAPHTQLCYRHFVDRGAHGSHFIDIGCGAGSGLRWLLQATNARLVGVDCDGKAVAFAREYVPEVEFIHADAESRRLHGSGSVAFVVDVLGFVPNPVRFLGALATNISQLDSLCIAEPEATLGQDLIAPARRAFSLQTLVAILTRAGFSIDESETLGCGMHCIMAHPNRDPASELIREAEQAYVLHQSKSVIDACDAIRRSSNAAIRAEAALLEAKLRFDLEQRDRAIALLSDARALEPDDPRPIAGLARLAITTGNREQSILLAELAARLDPLELSVPCSLALAYANESHARAQAAWATANSLAPDDSVVAQIAYAAAFVEGKHKEGLALMERLGRYQGVVTQVGDYAALGFLITAARHEYLSVGALAESLSAAQAHGRSSSAAQP